MKPKAKKPQKLLPKKHPQKNKPPLPKGRGSIARGDGGGIHLSKKKNKTKGGVKTPLFC